MVSGLFSVSLDLQTRKILAHQISATMDTNGSNNTTKIAVTIKNQLLHTDMAVSSLVLALKIC
ncbi:hypothetical protein I6H61_10905 (plasmid) [Leuconostoc pseudomesenteroides]|nr:hypothetical protein I6H61_10905 [Leuconostoc pseudomesenteroides]